MKAVDEITRSVLETDDERSWAESMGTDYRRAWASAPSLSILCLLAVSLATTRGFHHFLSKMLAALGGDGSQVVILHDALHFDSPPGRDAALALLHDLGDTALSESELADLVREGVSYENLSGAGVDGGGN